MGSLFLSPLFLYSNSFACLANKATLRMAWFSAFYLFPSVFYDNTPPNSTSLSSCRSMTPPPRHSLFFFFFFLSERDTNLWSLCMTQISSIGWMGRLIQGLMVAQTARESSKTSHHIIFGWFSAKSEVGVER